MTTTRLDSRQINRNVVQFVYEHLHPSYLVALLLLALFVGVTVSEDTPEFAWIMERSGLSPSAWMLLLGFGALTIVYRRSPPVEALLLSSGGIWLGWWVVRYTAASQPPFVVVFVFFGYIMTIIAMMLAAYIARLTIEQVALGSGSYAADEHP